MSFIETYKIMKQEKEIENNKISKENRLKKETEKREILSVLNENNIPDSEVSTNNYWFNFVYNNLFINFVNQSSRLCGEIYRIPIDKDEKECVKDAHGIMSDSDYSKNEKEEFQKYFNYRIFIFNGRPIQTTKNVLVLAKASLEDVMMLQGKRGMICLGDYEDLEKVIEYSKKAALKSQKSIPRQSLIKKILSYF